MTVFVAERRKRYNMGDRDPKNEPTEEERANALRMLSGTYEWEPDPEWEEVPPSPPLPEWVHEAAARGDRLNPCARCRVIYPSSMLRNVPELSDYEAFKHFCPDCYELMAATLLPLCPACRQHYQPTEDAPLCSACAACGLSIENAARELFRLNLNLTRARRVGLPATLTLHEWMRAVAHFQGLCAYCQRKAFSALEHVVPVSQGGGTTAQNCVPACASCNVRKIDRELEDVFPAQDVARVRAYLASV